jgi:hypothetical protein
MLPDSILIRAPSSPTCGQRRHSGSLTNLSLRVASTVRPMSEPMKGSFYKLVPCDTDDIAAAVAPLLIETESVVAAFTGTRDFVVFTNKRLIAVDARGLTGKRRDFTSLPYRRIQAFSVEAAGTFDLDPQLDLWFTGFGKVRLDFKGRADIRQVAQLIAQAVL